IDNKLKTVSITYDESMPARIVAWRPVLGCVQLAVGANHEAIKTLPQVAKKVRAPKLDDQSWPMGDANATSELPQAQQTALNQVVKAGFNGENYGGRTWGIVVVKDGKIVAERYDLNYDKHKGGQTHSAAKSFAS